MNNVKNRAMAEMPISVRPFRDARIADLSVRLVVSAVAAALIFLAVRIASQI